MRRALILIASVVWVLWGAATLAFVTLRMIPGDPVDVMLGPQAQLGEEARQALREELGLLRPLWEQYLSYLTGLLRGDLGESFQLRMPVADVLGRQLWPTVQLALLALVIALFLALCGAFLARNRRSRAVLGAVELIVLSSPVFWIGLLLLTVFSFGLGWFPVTGSRGAASLVLPAFTLALPCAALLGQVLRDGLESAERLPFVTTVRARGATDGRLFVRHTLRHASLGTLTMAGYLTGSLLGGAVLVEQVFARQGLGRVALSAIVDRDLPVVAGIIVFSAVVFVVINVLIEIAYPYLDPRVRDGRQLR